MFCTKCGAQNANSAQFCIKCGEKIGTGTAVPAKPAVSGPVGLRKDNRKLITMIAAAVAVILLFSLVFGGRGYKKTVSNFMDAFIDLNAKGMVNMLPDKVLQKALEEEGYSKNDLKFLIAELQDELDSSMSYVDMFGDYKLDYKILGAQDVSKERLSYIKENYSEIGVKVSAAKTVEVEMTIDVMGRSQTETVDIVVIKIGRSWYIDAESMDDIL